MMTQRKHYDVAVIGIGTMGSFAAAELSKRGFTVAGFDQFTPPSMPVVAILGSERTEQRDICWRFLTVAGVSWPRHADVAPWRPLASYRLSVMWIMGGVSSHALGCHAHSATAATTVLATNGNKGDHRFSVIFSSRSRKSKARFLKDFEFRKY